MTKTLFNGCLFQLFVFADQPVAFLFWREIYLYNHLYISDVHWK